MSPKGPRCIRFSIPFASLLAISVIGSTANAQQSTGRRILTPTTAKSGTQSSTSAAKGENSGSPSASPNSGCDFGTADGFSLPFDTCRAGHAAGPALNGLLTAAAANAKAVESIEYRDGDSRHRQRVTFEGRDRNALFARVLRIGPGGPGDVDGDGLSKRAISAGRGQAVTSSAAPLSPAVDSASYAATVVLVANTRDGVNALRGLWQSREGGPRAMSVQYLGSGSVPGSSAVNVRLERCTPFRFNQQSVAVRSAYTNYELELACTSARVNGANDRWAQLLSSVVPTAAALDSSTVMTSGHSNSFNLHGVRARSWSVEYLPENRAAPHRWTLEVRVQRVEMN